MSVIWGDDGYERSVIAEQHSCEDCGNPLQPPFIQWSFSVGLTYFCQPCAMSFTLRFSRDQHEIICGPDGEPRRNHLRIIAVRETVHAEAMKTAFPSSPEMWSMSEDEFLGYPGKKS